MCEPVSITLGVLSAGLGIAQGVAGYQQQVQNTNYANAQAEQNFRFQQMTANAQRGFEQMKKSQQDNLMAMTRTMADRAFENDIAQLNARLMQEQEAGAQKQQQAAKGAMQARGEVLASGRLGNSVDNLVADYYRQQAAFDYATERNMAFTTAQVQQQKRGVAAERGSRIASQQAYIMQPILDPLEPIYQAKPSKAGMIIGIGSSILGGVSTGMGTAAQIKGAGYSFKGGKYVKG